MGAIHRRPNDSRSAERIVSVWCYALGGRALGNLVAGAFVGLIAVWGGVELGLEWRVAWSLAAVPVVFGLFNVLKGQVFALFLAFGLGALLWSYTPLAEAVEPLIDKIMGDEDDQRTVEPDNR